MILTRRILIQMAVFILVSLTALAVMVFGYMRVPEMLGFGQYRVKVELPETGGRPVWAEVHIAPSLLGRLRQFGY